MPYHRADPPAPLSGMAVVLRNRASYELGCPGEGIDQRPLGGSTVLVTGCGKEAVYMERCATCEEYVSGTGDFLHGTTPTVRETACRCAYMIVGEPRPRTASVSTR